MTVKEIIEKLDLQCLNEANLDTEVTGAYASDLFVALFASPMLSCVAPRPSEASNHASLLPCSSTKSKLVLPKTPLILLSDLPMVTPFASTVTNVDNCDATSSSAMLVNVAIKLSDVC